MDSPVFFFFLFLVSMLHLLTTMDATTITIGENYNCNNIDGNFTAGSPYGQNRNDILSSLLTNTNPNGFYSESLGSGTSKIYARSFCRGDSPPKHCTACLSATAVDLTEKCPKQKKAISWGALDPPCTVQYSNRPILGNETGPLNVYYNTGDITIDQMVFDEVWLNLTRGLAEEAAKGSLDLKYATGKTVLPNNETVYALLQCSPDLSETLCRSCLLDSIDEYQSCCRGKQGGVTLKPSCNFRWEVYSFYGAPTFPPPPSISVASAPPAVTSYSAHRNETNGSFTRMIILLVVVAVVSVVLVTCIVVFIKQRRKGKSSNKDEQDIEGDEFVNEFSDEESLRFDLETARLATGNFSDAQKLGRGGFGAVYQGKLPNGKEIAVKRLSANSGQGQLEFKNEVVFLAKLQHRNLVRLLGFCTEGVERLLVYEYVPNSSLDNFIFDPVKSTLLNWELRYNIITGTARGMLYLHEDSRLRIIHRDLKASNILLDEDMNPKISDFGMAKLFSKGQGHADTSRIVGTYGYMAPEYVTQGKFSVKTDVFSFGVLILEIVSGLRSNNSFQNGKIMETLIGYAWRNWREGTLSNIIDPSLSSSSNMEMISRCIHIGLLCVEQNLENRPTMASVLSMLHNHSLALEIPSQPAFVLVTPIPESGDASLPEVEHCWASGSRDMSSTTGSLHQVANYNDVSVSKLHPR